MPRVETVPVNEALADPEALMPQTSSIEHLANPVDRSTERYHEVLALGWVATQESTRFGDVFGGVSPTSSDANGEKRWKMPVTRVSKRQPDTLEFSERTVKLAEGASFDATVTELIVYETEKDPEHVRAFLVNDDKLPTPKGRHFKTFFLFRDPSRYEG
jgi:hypothetical protein